MVLEGGRKNVLHNLVTNARLLSEHACLNSKMQESIWAGEFVIGQHQLARFKAVCNRNRYEEYVTYLGFVIVAEGRRFTLGHAMALEYFSMDHDVVGFFSLIRAGQGAFSFFTNEESFIGHHIVCRIARDPVSMSRQG